MPAPEKTGLPPATVPLPEGVQQALLFIPDISGFTRFVCGTEPRISKALIADLLDLIIESNIIGLEVCEIQGDAILFYKLGPPPSIEEIVNQCKQIFLDFQNLLFVTKRTLGQEAGLLLSESNLTLKIIVHHGLISTTRIHQFTKLMGKDVILVHRLLKNSVPGSEYILLSENYLATQDEERVKKSFEWTILNEATINIEYIGEVGYRYAHLTPLRLMVGENHPIESENDLTHQLTLDITVDAPSQFVLRVLKSFPLRPRWVEGLENISYNLEKTDRLTNSYIFQLKRGNMEVQPLRSMYSDDGIEYIEKISNLSSFPNSLLFYYLQETEEGTSLRLEFRYSKAANPKGLPAMFARKWMKRFLCQSLEGLKKLCEEMYHEQPVAIEQKV